MPYYREQFLNRHTDGSWTGQTAPRTTVQDSVELLSYRSRPHPLALTSVEVSDLTADPYAYFLTSTSERKYRDRLRERGLRAAGSPDRGHAFQLKRHRLLGNLHDVTDKRGAYLSNVMVYPHPASARLLDDVHSGSISGPASYKETGLDAFAQQAYRRVAPSSVEFDAAQFLGELREGLPRLVPDLLKSGSGFFKSAGSDYLNVEFGWKPFISDIQNAARALIGATNELSQQGKRVHRKYSLPPVTASGSNAYSRALTLRYGYPGFLSTEALATRGYQYVTTTTSPGTAEATHVKTRTVTRWFEGEFSSFLPLGFDPDSFLDRANALVNTKITPSVLWELAPWSWLVDWSLRIGDTIAANEMAANDLLVMHYGYAMERAVYTTNLTWRLTAQGTYHTLPTRGGMMAVTEYKTRLRANPYGFRTGGTGALSGGQLAVLGALGLTKTR